MFYHTAQTYDITNSVVGFLVYHILVSDEPSFALAVPTTQVEHESCWYSALEIKKERWSFSAVVLSGFRQNGQVHETWEGGAAPGGSS